MSILSKYAYNTHITCYFSIKKIKKLKKKIKKPFFFLYFFFKKKRKRKRKKENKCLEGSSWPPRPEGTESSPVERSQLVIQKGIFVILYSYT
jgi:hypothetical protein